METSSLFTVTDARGFLPTQSYSKDACWDLRIPNFDCESNPNGTSVVMDGDGTMHLLVESFRTVVIPTFVVADLEKATKMCGVVRTAGLVLPRSSTSARGILVHTGVIDEGYRGVMHIVLTNLNSRCIQLPFGSRIAQFMLFPMNGIEGVLSLLPSSLAARGCKGLGSSKL